MKRKIKFLCVCFVFLLLFSCDKNPLDDESEKSVGKPIISYESNEIISAYSTEKFDINVSKENANSSNTLETEISASFTPYGYGLESISKNTSGYSVACYSFVPGGSEKSLNIVSPDEYSQNSKMQSASFSVTSSTNSSSKTSSGRVLVRIDGYTDDIGEFFGDRYKAKSSEKAKSVKLPISILSEQAGVLRLNVSAKESSDSKEASSSKEINIVVNPLEVENVDLKIEKGWTVSSDEEEGYILDGEWVRGLGRYVYFSFDKESHPNLRQVVVNIYSTNADETKKERIHTMTIDRTFPRQPWTTKLNGTFIVEFYGKSSINGDESLISASKITIPNVFPFLYSHTFDCIPDTLYCGREYVFDLSETVDLDGEIEKFVFNFGKLNRDPLEQYVRDYTLAGKKGYYRKFDDRRRGDECADVFRITFSDSDFPEELPDDSTSFTTEFMVWADDGEAKKENLLKSKGNSFLKRTVTIKKVKEPVATFDMYIVNSSNEVDKVNGEELNLGALVTFDASMSYSGRGRKITNYRWFQKDATADDSEFKLFKESTQPSFNWSTTGYHKNNGWIGKKDFKLQIVCEKIGNPNDVLTKEYYGRVGTKLTLLPNPITEVKAYPYNSNYRFLTVKEDNSNSSLVTYFPLEVEFKLNYFDLDKDITKIGASDELIIDPVNPQLIRYDFYIQKKKEDGSYGEIKHIVSKGNLGAVSYQESAYAFATQKESYTFGNSNDLSILPLNKIPGEYRTIYQITKTKGVGKGEGVYCDTSYFTLFGKGEMVPAIDIKKSDGKGGYIVINDDNVDTLFRDNDLYFDASKSVAFEGKNIVSYMWAVGDDNSNGGFGIAQDPNTGALNAIGNNKVVSTSPTVNIQLDNVAFKTGKNYIWLGILDNAGAYKVGKFRLNITNRKPEITDIQMPSFIMLDEDEKASDIVVKVSVRDRDMTGLDKMTFKYYIGSNSTTSDDGAGEQWATVNSYNPKDSNYVEYVGTTNGINAEYRLHLAFSKNLDPKYYRGVKYLKLKTMDPGDGISDVYQESGNFGKKLNFYKLYFKFMDATSKAKQKAEDLATKFRGNFKGFGEKNLNPRVFKNDSLNAISYSSGLCSHYDKGGWNDDPEGDAYIVSALYFCLASELEGIGDADMSRYAVKVERLYSEGTGDFQDLLKFPIPEANGYCEETTVKDEIDKDRPAIDFLLMNTWHSHKEEDWYKTITTKGILGFLNSGGAASWLIGKIGFAFPGIGTLVSLTYLYLSNTEPAFHSFFFKDKSGLEASAIADVLKKYMDALGSGEKSTILSIPTTRIRIKVTVRDTYEGNAIVYLKAKDFFLMPLLPSGNPEDFAIIY